MFAATTLAVLLAITPAALAQAAAPVPPAATQVSAPAGIGASYLKDDEKKQLSEALTAFSNVQDRLNIIVLNIRLEHGWKNDKVGFSLQVPDLFYPIEPAKAVPAAKPAK